MPRAKGHRRSQALRRRRAEEQTWTALEPVPEFVARMCQVIISDFSLILLDVISSNDVLKNFYVNRARYGVPPPYAEMANFGADPPEPEVCHSSASSGPEGFNLFF